MRDTIENCTQALIEALQNSDEYKKFEESKTRMKEHPELRAQMDEFRKKVYLLQNSNSSIDMLDEMSKIFGERQEVFKNSLISDYLYAELRICRTLQKICMEIIGVTKLELEAFEDIISF